MTVHELSRMQMVELKERFLIDKLAETEDRSPSYGELADADSIVSDEEIFSEHEGIDFCNDDFFCSADA